MVIIPKSCSTWDVKNPAKNGINHQPQLVIVGFLNHQQYHYQKFIYLQVEIVSRPRPTTFSKKIACHEISPQFRGCVDILFFWDSCINWWSLLGISVPFPTKAQLLFGKAEFRVRFVKGFSGAYTRVPWRFCNCSTAEIILRPSRTTLEYLWILAALYVKWQFHTSIILTVLSYGSKLLSKVSSLLCFLPTRAIQLPWSIISQQKTCHESWVINMSWVIRIYYILCIICIFIYITYHIFSCIISSSYNPKNKIIPFASHHSPFSRFQSCLRWLLQFWK